MRLLFANDPVIESTTTLALRSTRDELAVLPSEIWRLRLLRVLDLTESEALVALPETLVQLAQLQELVLKDCRSLNCCLSHWAN